MTAPITPADAAQLQAAYAETRARVRRMNHSTVGTGHAVDRSAGVAPVEWAECMPVAERRDGASAAIVGGVGC
jgi:hypothetical protein